MGISGCKYTRVAWAQIWFERSLIQVGARKILGQLHFRFSEPGQGGFLGKRKSPIVTNYLGVNN